EGLELSRAKDQLQKQRRLARSEAEAAEALQSQLVEAEQQRRGAQVELAKSQRLRQEEGKRRQAAFGAEREELRQEVAQLSERLRVAEGGTAGWLALPSRTQAPARPPASNVSRLTSKQSAMSERWVDDDTVEAESVATGFAVSKPRGKRIAVDKTKLAESRGRRRPAMASISLAVLLLQLLSGSCHIQPVQFLSAVAREEPWYWALALDNSSAAELRSHWEAEKDYPEAVRSGIETKSAFHITLLFIGGATDEEFKAREGQKFEVSTSEFVWEEGRIAGVPMQLGDFYDHCANVNPHTTLGYKKGVSAVETNTMLARLGATRNFSAGLPEWLFQLHVDRYTEKITKYCKVMGIDSPEQLSQKAKDVAAAAEPHNVTAAAQLAGILGNATRGALHSHRLDAKLKMTGVLTATSATDAGLRLFEMIQLAKERADQRRELTDATEEVREQARALEVPGRGESQEMGSICRRADWTGRSAFLTLNHLELLAIEQVSVNRAAYVEASGIPGLPPKVWLFLVILREGPYVALTEQGIDVLTIVLMFVLPSLWEEKNGA
ncbi:unnamed protein product, partial [Symbiodinium sp. KB8]